MSYAMSRRGLGNQIGTDRETTDNPRSPAGLLVASLRSLPRVPIWAISSPPRPPAHQCTPGATCTYRTSTSSRPRPETARADQVRAPCAPADCCACLTVVGADRDGNGLERSGSGQLDGSTCLTWRAGLCRSGSRLSGNAYPAPSLPCEVHEAWSMEHGVRDMIDVTFVPFMRHGRYLRYPLLSTGQPPCQPPPPALSLHTPPPPQPAPHHSIQHMEHPAPTEPPGR